MKIEGPQLPLKVENQPDESFGSIETQLIAEECQTHPYLSKLFGVDPMGNQVQSIIDPNLAQTQPATS